MESQARIQGKTGLLFILIVSLIFLSVFDGYQGWWFLLFGIASAWGLCWFWARTLANNIHLRREIRFGWAQVGDRLEERFTLTNQGILPALWIELVDRSTLPNYQTNMVTGIDSRAKLQWRTHGVCEQRGLFTIGPTTLRTGDPLGIYTVEIDNLSTATLMVTPPIVPLPAIEVAPGGRAGEGRLRPHAPERTVSVAGVREYSANDSLRWVHWPTTARRDDFYVRTFDSTPSGDWWIILDTDESVQAGEGARSTMEQGVILAASLADRGLRLGRAVGVAAYGDNLAWLPPREGDGQRWKILRSLAMLTPAEKTLSELLNGVRLTLGHYTSVVIITPNIDGAWLSDVLPLLWQGIVPTVLLLDTISFGGAGDPQKMQYQLASVGVRSHIISPDLLDQPEAHPGKRGQWEWRISPTGKAIALNPKRDTAWKALR